MKFEGICFRGHDPRWAFTPLSGEGAKVKGGRFNPRGQAALYLSLDLATVFLEASQGFLRKLAPLTIVSYSVECDDIHDLTDPTVLSDLAIDPSALSDAWAQALAENRRPRSWDVAERLINADAAGIIVPSFAPGAGALNKNLVLWQWGSAHPHKVEAFDPSNSLPKNQLSWN